jgi:tetratricopeptide (TPR) repeat protein
MKKTFLFCFLLSFSASFVLAQPTAAEIQKQLDDAMKKMKEATNDPKLKAAIEEARKISLQPANPTSSNNITNTGTSSKSYPRKLPAKNNSLLSTIPKKIFSKTELAAYCNGLYKQLAGKISPAKVKAVNDVMAKPGSNSYKYNLVAVSAWYNGAVEEAILMATKAAAQNPGDDVLLNNLSAMLNLGGLEQNAILILQTLLQQYPDNPMLLNNMGQAYAGLGDQETAMLFFGRCIAQSPNHPEANNTAGQIELSKGNKEKAKEHFEKSLQGAYNTDASGALRYLDPQPKYGKLFRPKVHIPEYFNFHKYELPVQCESMSQAPAAKAEHEAYKEMLTDLIKKYDAIGNVESDLALQTLLKKYGPGTQFKSFPPFVELGMTILVEVSLDYTNEIMGLDKYNQNFFLELKKLESDYSRSKLECGPAASKYLPLFASLRRDWQVKNINLQKKYLDERIYWSYLASHNIHDFRKSFYAIISSALSVLHGLAATKIPYSTSDCDWKEGNKQIAEAPALTEPECPFTVELKFIAGKIAIDCEKFSFSGGEGVIFKYEKNFKGGQSTISLGIGAQLELGGGFGGVNIGGGISASECLFIALDGNGHATDAGLKFEATAGAKAELDGAIGKNINIKKDLTGVEAVVGYTIGMESGIKVDEGPLKNLVNPPEKQINKNVPLYKQGG